MRPASLRSAVGAAQSLVPRLPGTVWVLEAGGLVNSLGSGFVLPFSVIYFHNVRGFALSEATAIVAVISALGIATGPLAGTASDRFSPRATLVVSLALMAIGYVGFPFVRSPWEAFLLAVVAGAGNGGFYPSQATLLGELVPSAQRHVGFSLQRAMSNLGYGLGGLVGGLIATTTNPASFNILFFVDAATFVAFIAVLLGFVATSHAAHGSTATPGRYREVIRDHIFLRLLVVNAVLITAGYALSETIVPAYAKNHAGVPDSMIGAFFLVGTLTIVLAQLPIVRLLEGSRRMPMLALVGILWALALLIVLTGGTTLSGTAAGAVMMVAFVFFAIGECLLSPVVSPMAADLAPPRLLGRYMALTSFTWQLGLAVGPAAGGLVLQGASSAVWVIGAALCLIAGLGALSLDRHLPDAIRCTPRTPPSRPQLLRRSPSRRRRADRSLSNLLVIPCAGAGY